MRQRMPYVVVQVAMGLPLSTGFAVYTGQTAICKVRQEEGGRLMSRVEAGAPCAPGPEFWASPALGTKAHVRLSSLMSLGFVCLLLTCWMF